MNRVITDIDDLGVAWVRLNNPDRHNAFDDQIIGQLTEAFAGVAVNPNVRVMVLGLSISASHNREIEETKFGLFRM